MIRRTDVELNDDQLETLLYGSNLGRNADIADLISVINEIDGSFSIFLDGKWGSGKTYFVKQTKIILHALNDKLKDSRKNKIREIGEFKYISLSGNYYPVYYNAWKHDSDMDPLISLIGTLVSEMEDWNRKIGKDKWKAVCEAFSSLLGIIGINVDIQKIRNALGNDILEPFDREMEIRKKFEGLIDILVEGRAEKLVLFIDELDRCSPAFAMKLLERIKFIFGYEKIIVIFSTNVEQLNNMVKKLYGEKTDGYAYLSRFYDMKFHIRSIGGIEYISALVGAEDRSAWLSTTVMEMTENFTLRDCNRYLQEIERHLELKKELGTKGTYYRGPTVPTFFWHILVPILLAIKMEDPLLYQKIINGTDSKSFEQKVQSTRVYHLAREGLMASSGMSLYDVYNECFSDHSSATSFRSCALKFISKDITNQKT